HGSFWSTRLLPLSGAGPSAITAGSMPAAGSNRPPVYQTEGIFPDAVAAERTLLDRWQRPRRGSFSARRARRSSFSIPLGGTGALGGSAVELPLQGSGATKPLQDRGCDSIACAAPF